MYKQITSDQEITREAAPAVAITLFENTTTLPQAYASLDELSGGALSAAVTRPEFSAAKGALTPVYPAADASGPERYFILGLGSADKPNPEGLRLAAGQLVRAAEKAGLEQILIEAAAGVEGRFESLAVGRALADGLVISNEQLDAFKGSVYEKSQAESKSPKPEALAVAVDSDVAPGFQSGLTIAEAVNEARRLGATPPNVANPHYIAEYCRKMSSEVGLSCTVLDEKKAEELKMGGLLAVGRAGSTPPVMICLEHKPKGATNASEGPVLLVGKAITFDTGGYSLKPSASMTRMKYDKQGGMAVLAAMHAIAALDLPVHVVGMLAVAENMVSSEAYRPDDILTMYNGVTVEVTNTDAEGRLVLADALAYGCETYKPSAVVDVATLTGGVVVALGKMCAGCFCGQSGFRDQLFTSGDFVGEKLWHLPLWDEHKELLKSAHADTTNSGGREGHPIQGAAFLSYFVDPEVPWAHLDIAGMSDVDADKGLYVKGPTGYGVRLLVRSIETWQSLKTD